MSDVWNKFRGRCAAEAVKACPILNPQKGFGFKGLGFRV